MRRIGWALLLTAATANPSERYVDADGIVAARLNGTAARLRIDPAATAMPLLTADAAQRARLKPGPFAVRYAVGPERVAGRTAVAKMDLGSGERRQRVAWADRPYAAGFDGVVGPGGVPEAIVTFRLRAKAPGERIATLPMIDQGGLAAGWGERFGQIVVAGQPLRVRFDPHHPRTLATASAAARIARAHDGVFTGGTDLTEIAFDIGRPVRGLRLARPLVVGPLAIDALGVRTADMGSAAAIREEGSDPDEVEVSAGRKPDPRHDRLSIGADLLERCSTISFDKAARVIRLSCR
jgi:hypothetical protein